MNALALNPLAEYKENMDYTYDELAKQFEVSRSVVQRAIEGAYYSLPPSIVDKLSYIEGKPKEKIELAYDAFVNNRLAKVDLPPVAIDRNTSLDDFDIWCSLLLRINGISFVGDVPKLSVARLLHINTAVIVNFYSGRTAQMPEQILERIEQIDSLHE